MAEEDKVESTGGKKNTTQKIAGKANPSKAADANAAPMQKEGCSDERCPRHGSLKTRGRIFEGKVVSVKAGKTAVVELQYLRSVPKYERFEKRRSKHHVHVPECYKIKEGDTIKFMECRKLSKTKAFAIIE